MNKTITQTIAEYTNEVLASLDNLSFFTDEETRGIAFRYMDILQDWGDIRNPQNVLEEDLLEVCSKPEEMQQYFVLMLSQIPKCSILNKYDERLERYKERFGNELAEQAEYLIEWLTNSLDSLMYNLLKAGTKYGLTNPYEEEWLNELRDTVGQTDTKPGATENTEQSSNNDSDLESMLPEQLKTDEAIRFFGRAITAKLIKHEEGRLKWTKSNALLAFFCGILYCGDTRYQDTITKDYVIKRGSTFFPESALNALFGVKNLGQSRTQLERLPKGYEEIDKLFKAV